MLRYPLTALGVLAAIVGGACIAQKYVHHGYHLANIPWFAGLPVYLVGGVGAALAFLFLDRKTEGAI